LGADRYGLRTPHLLAESGNAEASFFADLGAFAADDLRIDEHQLLLRVFGHRQIDHCDAFRSPICGAANPTPLAAYMDSNISEINW